MDQQHLPIPLLSKISSPTHTVQSLHCLLYLSSGQSLWLLGAYSRRGNDTVYITGVTPYIPGADGVKNSLVRTCELFHNYQILTNYDWNLYIGKY